MITLQINSKALISVGTAIILGLALRYSNSNLSQSSQIETKHLAKPCLWYTDFGRDTQRLCCRRFVKTTISDLGYADYSEYFIGHSGSTYWRKKDSEKAEIFRKIEPYLTFLNVHQLERQGADIQTKVEELEQLNQSMIDRDKMKDDAIAHLSDQLVAITNRLQELERRQVTI